MSHTINGIVAAGRRRGAGTHRKSEYSSLANLSTKLLFPTADSPVLAMLSI